MGKGHSQHPQHVRGRAVRRSKADRGDEQAEKGAGESDQEDAGRARGREEKVGDSGKQTHNTMFNFVLAVFPPVSVCLMKEN